MALFLNVFLNGGEKEKFQILVHPPQLYHPDTHLLISRDGVRDDAEAGGQEVGVTVTDQPTGLAAVDDPEV